MRQTAMALKVPRATLARTLAASQKVGAPKALVEPRRSRAGAGGGSVMHFRDATEVRALGACRASRTRRRLSRGNPASDPDPLLTSRMARRFDSQKSARRPAADERCAGCSVVGPNPDVATLHVDRRGVLRVDRVLVLGDVAGGRAGGGGSGDGSGDGPDRPAHVDSREPEEGPGPMRRRRPSAGASAHRVPVRHGACADPGPPSDSTGSLSPPEREFVRTVARGSTFATCSAASVGRSGTPDE